jgi:hypothetical protein
MTEPTLRSQEEIVARIQQTSGEDWLGFKREVLASCLDFEHAKPYLVEGTTAEEWTYTPDVDVVLIRAKEYFTFAIGKALDHRGISASRSIDKLTEYAWLLGRDDVVSAMDEADYPQYGVPKLKAFGEGFGLWVAEHQGDAELSNMADGEPCEPGCDSGCSR